MDGRRVGRIVRALRRRRGWRQVDLARAVRCSQQTISVIERGHVGDTSIAVLGRILVALDAWLVVDVRWRAGALERLLDEDHARLVAAVAERLVAAGWAVQLEVTYSEYGERGAFDLLAFRDGVVLVVEVKTDLVSAEATLRKLDEKGRLAATVGRERFAWQVRDVGRLLVFADRSTTRRRVARQAQLFDRALPTRGADVRRWLARPDGALAGIWFAPDTSASSVIQRRGGRERVRRPGSEPPTSPAGR
jgi:transcriptional regulator with XRE-family HTH domain